MADPRFFSNQGPFPLSALARAVGGDIAGAGDGALEIGDVVPLDGQADQAITWAGARKYARKLAQSQAIACVLREEDSHLAPPHMALIIAPNPHLAFARISQLFYPLDPIVPGIAPTASIHDSAQIGQGCEIGPGVVIEAGVEIGVGTRIGPNAVIRAHVAIGRECDIGPHVSVTHALVGDHVTLHPGVRIGQDGFGFAPDGGGHVRLPQLGRAIIQDWANIGANTTIDRGAGEDTVIGAGSWIDNQCQIGHNVMMGRGCILSGQVGLSGSVKLGDFVMIGGKVGIADHVRVGSMVQIAAGSGVIRDVGDGEKIGGRPAVPMKEWMRQLAFIAKMGKKGARFDG